MNDFTTNLSTLKDIVANQGSDFSRPYGFFKLDDGETGTYRMVSGIEEMAITSHKCGLTENEISTRVWNETTQAGQAMKCPQCGEALEQTDIVAIRPGIQTAYMHSFVPSSSNKNARFVCLNHLPSNLDEFGKPKIPCPICEIKGTNDKGQVVAKYPARLVVFGFALLRKKVVEPGNVNGVFTSVVSGVETVTENDEPSIVLIERGINFWKPFIAINDQYGAISYWDYDITRVGREKNTTYTSQRVPGDPNVVPFATYGEKLLACVESLSSALAHWSSAKNYDTNGWGAGGPMTAGAGTAQPAPISGAVQAPVAAQVIGGTTSYAEIASTIGSSNGNIANYI